MIFVYSPFIIIAVPMKGETETKFFDSPILAGNEYDRLVKLPNIKTVSLYERKQIHIQPYGKKGNPQ